MHFPSLRIFPLVVSIFMLCANNGIGHLDNVYNMVTYSSLDSRNTDSTQALLKAWSLACQSNIAGTVNVPPGTYLLNAITLKGPCNSPITLNVDGVLMATSDPSIGEDHWILFTDVDGLTISGNGTFDGQGQKTWKHCQGSSCPTRPASLKFNDVKNAIIQGIRSMNSKFFHFHICHCENFYVNNGVTITAPGDSPNTDGMHISHSNNVQVNIVQIATGDDCISLGPGSTNIQISNVECGPGHGFSIGSLGKSLGEAPVQGVSVSDSTLTNTTNGVRIKTFGSSSPGSVSDITFQNIMVNDVQNPIIIDQHYCPHGSCEQKGESQVKISNVKFVNISGISSSEVSVKLDCSRNTPCQGIVLQDINLTYKDTNVPSKATCLNINGEFQGNQVPPRCTNMDPNPGSQVPPNQGSRVPPDQGSQLPPDQGSQLPPTITDFPFNRGNHRSHLFRISFLSLFTLLSSWKHF